MFFLKREGMSFEDRLLGQMAGEQTSITRDLPVVGFRQQMKNTLLI